jgi:DNA-binding transcriptional regulator YhcF (GntR family)
VREIATRHDVSEERVRKVLQNLRKRGFKVAIVGKRDGLNVYKVSKTSRKKPNILKAAKAPPRQLYSLPDAAEASPSQIRELTAKTIKRDCLRCKKSFSTTRNGPRYCDHCRRFITSHT